jgi:hypothetical protein
MLSLSSPRAISVSVDSEFEKAVSRIQIEVSKAAGAINAPINFLYAVAAMKYVHTMESPFVYDYYLNNAVPITSVEQALVLQAGLCGWQELTFGEILHRLGVPYRTVSVYQMEGYNSPGHVMAEVWYYNKWNLFDISSCTYFHDNNAPMGQDLSIEEIRANPREDTFRINQTSLEYLAYKTGWIEYYQWSTGSTADILYSGSGVIRIMPMGNAYDFTNLPNYVGHYYSQDYCYADLKAKLLNVTGTNLLFNVAMVDGIGKLIVSDGSRRVETTLNSAGSYSIDISALNVASGLMISGEPAGSGFYLISFNGITQTGQNANILYENNTGSTTSWAACSGGQWEGQTFTPAIAHFPTKIKLYLSRAGNPGRLNVQITTADVSGKPTRTILYSGSIDANILSTSPSMTEIALTPIGGPTKLTQNVRYALIWNSPTGNSSDICRVWMSSNGYAGGTFIYSLDDQATWFIYTGADYLFEEWGLR